MKANGLISLVEEISIQPNIDTKYKVKKHQEVKAGVHTGFVTKDIKSKEKLDLN